MRDIKKLYFSLAGWVTAVFLIISGLAIISFPFYRSVFPPTWPVTFFLFFQFLGLMVGALFHAGLFLLLNYYLVRRHNKGMVYSPFRAAMPSVGYFIATASLALWWFFGGISYGLKYQGFFYTLIYGILNIIAVACLGMSICLIIYSRTKKKMVLTDQALLVYNFCIHLSALLVLFPYLGETP